MARPRHKHVLRKPYRRRLVRLGLAASAVLALGTPATAVVWPDEQPVAATPVIKAKPVRVRTTPVPMRVAPIARAEARVRLEEKPPEVVDHKFATAPLNVRTEPSEKARLLDVLASYQKIGVSGETKGEWAEVVLDGKSRWVHRAYLADSKPKPERKPADPAPSQDPTPTTASPEPTPTPAPEPTPSAPTQAGLSTAACATGSEVESGLVAGAVTVHRAVCAAFPQVTSYGGLRPGDTGDHGTGHALDIMISDSATGDQIAEWARANASALGVSQVIWAQRIWTVQRNSEGWRAMEDRGSATANHYDHVHVTVY